jgi:diguanylate cyclase (GGDEF)-like protein
MSDQNLLIKTGSLSIDSRSLDSNAFYLLEGEQTPDITVPKEGIMSGDDLSSERILLTAKDPFAFGILVSDYSDAYRLWVNGVLMDENGSLSDGRYAHRIIEINPDNYVSNSEGYILDIVMQRHELNVAAPSFGHIMIGSLSALNKSDNIRIALNALASGIYALFFILSIFLFYSGMKEKHILLFSITNLVSLIRSLFLVNPIFIGFISSLPFNVIVKTELITAILNSILIFLLYESMFKGYVARWLKSSILIFNSTIILLAAISNIMPFKIGLQSFYFPLIAICFFPTAYINIRAILDRKANTLLLFVGMMVYAFSAFFQAASVKGLIPLSPISIHMNIAQYGSLFYFILFGTVLMIDYGRRYTEINSLKNKYANKNEYLEKALERRMNELNELNSFLTIKAASDSLTSLLNHSAIIENLESEIIRASRYGNDLALMMFDVDYFRKINTQYGHLEGDRVLVHLSRKISGLLRHNDNLGRYGGEEFLAILPETELKEAMSVAERICRSIDSMDSDPVLSQITISIGVTEYNSGDEVQDMIKRADLQLYKAKDAGRNQVI